MYQIIINNSQTLNVNIISLLENDIVCDIQNQLLSASIHKIKENKYHIILNDKSFQLELISINNVEKTINLKLNNSLKTLVFKDKFDLLLQNLGLNIENSNLAKTLKAPMPGMILKVLVEVGQSIKKGDAMIILEAMKMENILKAPQDCVIKSIQATKGTVVEKNQTLINL